MHDHMNIKIHNQTCLTTQSSNDNTQLCLSTACLHGQSNAEALVTLPLYLTSVGNKTETEHIWIIPVASGHAESRSCEHMSKNVISSYG
jgi:hypothetical protein